MKRSFFVRLALKYSANEQYDRAFVALCQAHGMILVDGIDLFLARLASEMEEQERREEEHAKHVQSRMDEWNSLKSRGEVLCNYCGVILAEEHRHPGAFAWKCSRCGEITSGMAFNVFMFENRKRSAPFSDLAKQVAETQTKPGAPCCRKHAESVWMFNDMWKDLKEDCGS